MDGRWTVTANRQDRLTGTHLHSLQFVGTQRHAVENFFPGTMTNDEPDPERSAPAGSYARRAMGVRLLGDALKRKRGQQGLSQKAAAATWPFPYSTLCALEQGEVRNYQITTVAPLDAILGFSAWDLLQQSDEPVEPITRGELDEVRRELAALAAAVADLAPRAPAGQLEELGLSDDEAAEVVAFAHFVLARRRRVNGS